MVLQVSEGTSAGMHGYILPSFSKDSWQLQVFSPLDNLNYILPFTKLIHTADVTTRVLPLSREGNHKLCPPAPTTQAANRLDGAGSHT